MPELHSMFNLQLYPGENPGRGRLWLNFRMDLIVDSKLDSEFRAYQFAESAGEALVAIFDNC
jgi:hypothetical protein